MLPFEHVNQNGSPAFRRGYQRHHILPLQIRSVAEYRAMLVEAKMVGVSLNDFRRNGVLLPATEYEAMRSGRPLHRGPHPRYNDLLMARLSQINRHFVAQPLGRLRSYELRMRMRCLQKGLVNALARRDPSLLFLNKRDPSASTACFQTLDAQVDELWSVSQPM